MEERRWEITFLIKAFFTSIRRLEFNMPRTHIKAEHTLVILVLGNK